MIEDNFAQDNTSISKQANSFNKLLFKYYIAIVRNRERGGEDVNQRHSNNRTLLMFAAAKNKIALLRLLLKHPSIEVMVSLHFT